MSEVVYFSKNEYREVIEYGNTSSIMLLNIPERELSYQVYDWKRQMPAIEGVQPEQWGEHTWTRERLYRYLVKTFFEGNKKLRGWGPTYGGCSLFF